MPLAASSVKRGADIQRTPWRVPPVATRPVRACHVSFLRDALASKSSNVIKMSAQWTVLCCNAAQTGGGIAPLDTTAMAFRKIVSPEPIKADALCRAHHVLRTGYSLRRRGSRASMGCLTQPRCQSHTVPQEGTIAIIDG